MGLYIAPVLEPTVPVSEAFVKASDGAITTNMMLRAKHFRAEQRAPFPEDSADLIREARHVLQITAAWIARPEVRNVGSIIRLGTEYLAITACSFYLTGEGTVASISSGCFSTRADRPSAKWLGLSVFRKEDGEG